jgi:MoaA/NifB/PqqE/SkfB family radical SAM enzyme
MNTTHVGHVVPAASPLDFLWVELTNRCNLRCVHCYAESGPDAEIADPLTATEYEAVLQQAADVGCRKVQFIGGEPTLNRHLGALVERAAGLGYEFIEIYTNLTRLSDAFITCLLTHRVQVATSIYAPTAAVHDRITAVRGSFARTTANVRKLVAMSVAVRASVVEMEENAGLLEETVRFLEGDLGVRHIKVDRRRPFGRGGEASASGMEHLCGACAGATLCVAPDGVVSPCIMSKRWSLGSVRDERLGDIALSARLGELRASIGRAMPPAAARTSCDPDNIGCPPLNKPPTRLYSADSCDPSTQCTPVIGCPPLNRCGPEINGASYRRQIT